MWSAILPGDEVDEDILSLAVGDNDLDARLLNAGGGGVFGMHAASAECALLRLNIFAEVTLWGYNGDNLRFGVIGMTGEDTIDVAQQDEHVSLHHLGNQSAEFVVVGEHKLSDAHGVVLVDDRNHPILEHYGHTSLLILILLSRIEVFLHSQNLSDVQMMLTEEVIIKPDELHLTESLEQLTLLHRVEVVIHLQFAPAASHSTG